MGIMYGCRLVVAKLKSAGKRGAYDKELYRCILQSLMQKCSSYSYNTCCICNCGPARNFNTSHR